MVLVFFNENLIFLISVMYNASQPEKSAPRVGQSLGYKVTALILARVFEPGLKKPKPDASQPDV